MNALALQPWGELVTVRPLDARPGTLERRLVLDSWARSWAPHGRPPMRVMQAMSIAIDHLARCDRVLVAEVPGVAGPICGWVARMRPGVLCYLYVVQPYRRRGLANRLMTEVGLAPRDARWRYTFATPRLRRLCRFEPADPQRVPWRGVDGASKG